MGENYVKNQEPESEGSELKEAKTNRGKREVNQHVKEREVWKSYRGKIQM